MKFVRIRNDNGTESTVTDEFAEMVGVEPLDADATDPRGKPLSPTRSGRPMKDRTSVQEAATKKPPATKAEQRETPTGGDAASSKPEEAS